MSFQVIVSQSASEQIIEQTAWYELKQDGLGVRFESVVSEHISLLETIPFAYVRYDNVRCIPIKGFPFMLHIGINEEQKQVNVYALIHTAREPESNWGKDDWFVSEPVYYYGQVTL